MGEGGKVLKGGNGLGGRRKVYLGSNSRDAGVPSSLRIDNASFDPCSEAVVKESVKVGYFSAPERSIDGEKGSSVGCHLLLVGIGGASPFGGRHS